MPRKKVTKPETRSGEDINEAQPGDYCYYLSPSNKPMFAEIKKVITENDILVLQLVCQSEYKWLNLPASICAFDERDLKGKKRADLFPKVK
tara:strand:+ start:259 stop:531 length:273 start_codon:yes stop_codon:yes gene_type:complete